MCQEDNHMDFETDHEESFEELLNQSMKKPIRFNSGEKVEAPITQITNEWVFIDVGGKSDGFIMINEFFDGQRNLTVKEGDTVSAYFLSSKNHELIFTTKLTGDSAGNEHLEEAYRSGIPVEGLVEKEIKGGFGIKVAGNTRAFCPFSQMGLRRIDNAGSYVGRHLTFKIIEYGQKGRNVIVSHRAVLEEERKKQKATLMKTLQEGMIVQGEITSIQRFGAFVDIGGIEGLIPISEIAWGRVEDINGILSAGQIVEVAVKKLDWEKDKFSFSIKEVQPNPWQNIAFKFPEGSIHRGKVARLVPFGAFVTLEAGVDGLVHVSELGKGKKINHPKEILETNQMIDVKITKVDEAGKRLSLAMASREEESEQDDDYKKHLSTVSGEASGTFGTLGDIFREKMGNHKKD